VEFDDDDGQRCVAIVMSVSEKQIQLIRAADARPTSEIEKAGKAGGRLALTPKLFFRRNPVKVDVRHLGDVLPAND
jgi:hypothetical protein